MFKILSGELGTWHLSRQVGQTTTASPASPAPPDEDGAAAALAAAPGSRPSCGQHLSTLAHSTARRDREGVSRGREGMGTLHHNPSSCPLVGFLLFFFSRPSF